MTETMLNRIARTMVERTGYNWDSSPQTNWRATAKIAVRAMQEPTDSIRELAASRGISLKDYQAVIDLILAEPPWPSK
jgi:hypothetical protein